MVAPGRLGVELFATCLVDQFRPEAGEAAARVLEDAGFEVRFDPRQTCCGQPALNLGHLEEARAAARRLIAVYGEGEDPVVVPSGSCATTMKRLLPGLFAAGSRERERAERLAGRVEEWSRFLVRSGYAPPVASGLAPVTLHPACHGLRELGIRDEPERLVRAAGYPVVPLPRAEECCGFGGAFSVLMPEASGGMLRAKLDGVAGACAAGARVVASLDAGCLMHMAGGEARRRRGPAPAFRHVAELLDAARRSGGEGGGGGVAPDP